MDLEQLGKKIYQKSYLKGHFLLRSGVYSEEYFDKYQFESDPFLLNEISIQLKNLLPPSVELLAGLEMGGIPIATMLSYQTKLPLLMVRKKAKSYGTLKIAEGTPFEGKKIAIIEDVITSGGQVLLSADELIRQGAQIECVICVIERSIEGKEAILKKGLKLFSLFQADELKKWGAK